MCGNCCCWAKCHVLKKKKKKKKRFKKNIHNYKDARTEENGSVRKQKNDGVGGGQEVKNGVIKLVKITFLGMSVSSLESR